jgi:hypothetical protein
MLLLVKEPTMFCESSLFDYRYRAYRLLQRSIARLGLPAVALVSNVLYVAGLAMAGAGPIPIIEVKLTEFTIEMPRTVPPGPVSFSVTNAGTMEHNFEVEGQSLEKKFVTDLKPGETKSLQVDLPAGKYTVYCPLKDHRHHGMHLELMVAQQQTNRVTPPATFPALP